MQRGMYSTAQPGKALFRGGSNRQAVMLRCRQNVSPSLENLMADQCVTGLPTGDQNGENEHTHECLDILVDQSLWGEHVGEATTRLAAARGRPAAIKVDNGSEFAGKVNTQKSWIAASSSIGTLLNALKTRNAGWLS